jgi:hypothetical protein
MRRPGHSEPAALRSALRAHQRSRRYRRHGCERVEADRLRDGVGRIIRTGKHRRNGWHVTKGGVQPRRGRRALSNFGKHRIVTESISGSVAASERPGFAKLLDRMESGDVLLVTKLDRLSRNAIDVRTTVERLSAMGVRAHCVALGGVDRTRVCD